MYNRIFQLFVMWTKSIDVYKRHQQYARHVIQFAVGLYMLGYLGFLQHENMQIEGFWYYLFLGVFEAATLHYDVAKIFGPFIFGRGWCCLLYTSRCV